MRLFFILIVGLNFTYAQNTFIINGFVKDKLTGEPLIGANIYSPKLKNGASTNQYGFYSLQLKADSVVIEVSFIGYRKNTINLYLINNLRLDFDMSIEQDNVLNEVTIIANDDNLSSTQISINKIRNEYIAKSATVLGEADVIKSLQLLPGVQSGSEGFSTLSVRGGNYDQNLLLMDHVPVYNFTHLFGFLSTINPEIVRDVTFIKGGIPARYGERLSSVTDIVLREGDFRKSKGSVSISPLTSQLTVEGPIVKEKSSILFSVRRTWLDVLLNLVSSDNPIKYNFGDINIKYNYNLNSNNKLYIGFTTASDKFNTDLTSKNSDYRFRWGNSAYHLKWNKVYSDKLFGTILAYSSNLKFIQKYSFEDGSIKQFRSVKSLVRDNSISIDFDYFASSNHEIRFGVQSSWMVFKPEVIELVGIEIDQNAVLPSKTEGGLVLNGYLEDEIKLSKSLTANIGLRQSIYITQNKTYYFTQPRITAAYLLFSSLSLRASFNRTSQYLHLLSNTSIKFPVDLWVPSTANTKPEVGNQFAFGILKAINRNKHSFSVTLEGYYRTMRNVIEYKDGANYLFGSQDNWEHKIVSGKGESYGIEAFVEKASGKMKGWLSYTISYTDRMFPEIDDGKPFPFKYDRRNNLSIFTSYDFTKFKSLSFVFVLRNGQRVTLPEGKFESVLPPNYEYTNRYQSGEYKNDFESNLLVTRRNNYQLPLYHRLDLNYQTSKITKRKNKRTWVFSIYNVYNRMNAFMIYEEDGRIKKFTLFPIIPSIGYKVEF